MDGKASMTHTPVEDQNRSHPTRHIPPCGASFPTGRALAACLLTVVSAAALGQTALTTQPATAPQIAPASKAPPMITSDYVFQTFDAKEGWVCRANGPAGSEGSSSLLGRTWTFDFSQGAKSIGIVPAEVSMLGEPQEIRLHLRGDSLGHPLRLQVLTHFMTFERTIDPLEGDALHEISLPAPPADGWRWSGGENDGKIHGPLRIRGLFLDAAGKRGSGQIELIDVRITARCPATRTSLLTARLQNGPGGPQFVASVRSQTPQPMEAKLDCIIRDWDGRPVAQRSQSLRITSSQPSEFAVLVPSGDHAFLEAEFTCQSDGQETLLATAARVASTTGDGSDQLNPASPFGMGLYLNRYENAADMDRAAAMAREIGVKWSREEFAWSVIEPRKGTFDWSFYDRVVATAKRNGISVYGLLDYWTRWTQPYTPEGIEDYCRYVRAVVQRYKGDIHHWEIWNEPNIFFWQGPKDMYADLLKAAYKTIKEGDPDAQVAGCSTSGIDRPFIDRIQNLGGPFDILTIHPYRRDLVDRQFIRELQQVATMVNTPAGATRPVWITEMGWSTHVQHNAVHEGPSVDPRQQACLLVRAYVDALASGSAPNISWYDFRNDGDNPMEWEHNFGVVTQEFEPKPAYRAYATLARMLHDGQYQNQVDFGPGVMAFGFTRPGGQSPVIVAWAVDRQRTVVVQAPQGLVVTNLMGESNTRAADAGEVQVDLLRGVPVFLTLTGSAATQPVTGRQ